MTSTGFGTDSRGSSADQGKFDYLHASMRIGSCKAPIQYNPQQTVFHHDDIPKASRRRKAEVLNWKKSMILSNERAQWAKSTDPNVPVCERRQMENFVMDRSKKYTFNYRAESVDSLRNCEPIDRPTKFHVSSQLESTASKIEQHMNMSLINRGQFKRTQEMPVHNRADEVGSWNSSTTITPKDISTGLDRKTKKALSSTSKSTTQLLKSSNYVSPKESVSKLSNLIVEQKRDQFFDPRLWVNRPRVNEAEVFTKNESYNHEAIEKDFRYKTDSHSGAWQFNESENRFMWSDTGSFKYNSKGDRIHSHNPNGMNLPSF
jgi:hypothetical protein